MLPRQGDDDSQLRYTAGRFCVGRCCGQRYRESRGFRILPRRSAHWRTHTDRGKKYQGERTHASSDADDFPSHIRTRTRGWSVLCVPGRNTISAAEGDVADRIDQVRCVELALIEHRGRKKPSRASTDSRLHRLHRSGDPRYIEDALEIVGQFLKAHFGAHPSQRPGQEVGGPHPILQRAEDVPDRASLMVIASGFRSSRRRVTCRRRLANEERCRNAALCFQSNPARQPRPLTGRRQDYRTRHGLGYSAKFSARRMEHTCIACPINPVRSFARTSGIGTTRTVSPSSP